MVTVTERPITTDARRESGLLGKRVEHDIANVLDEFGSAAPAEKRPARVYSFGYGIPMAGVRYYSFLPEN